MITPLLAGFLFVSLFLNFLLALTLYRWHGLLARAQKALEDHMLVAVAESRHESFPSAPPVSEEYRTKVFCAGEATRRAIKAEGIRRTP